MGKTKQHKRLKRKKINPKIVHSLGNKTIKLNDLSGGSGIINTNAIVKNFSKSPKSHDTLTRMPAKCDQEKGTKRTNSTVLLEQFYQLVTRSRPVNDEFRKGSNAVRGPLIRSASACPRLLSPTTNSAPLSIDQGSQTVGAINNSPSSYSLELKQDNLYNHEPLEKMDSDDFVHSGKRLRKYSSMDDTSPTSSQVSKKSKSVNDSVCAKPQIMNIQSDKSKRIKLTEPEVLHSEAMDKNVIAVNNVNIHSNVSQDGLLAVLDKRLKNIKSLARTSKSFDLTACSKNPPPFEKTEKKSSDSDGVKNCSTIGSDDHGQQIGKECFTSLYGPCNLFIIIEFQKCVMPLMYLESGIFVVGWGLR